MAGRSTRMIILMILFINSTGIAAERDGIDKTNSDRLIDPPPASLDFCQMTEACYFPTYNINSLASGNRIVSYYDPGLECSAPAYPFEIATLWITFNDACNPCVLWPFDVDLVVYDPTQPGDPCQGPGTEIYRESYSCDEQTYSYPNVGPLTLSTPLCVDDPFFVGIEYTGQPFGLYPPIMIGDVSRCPTDECHHWGGYGNNWWEWSDYWGSIMGAPAFWVDGETNSINCAPNQNVPTLSQWGMLIMTLLLLTCGAIGVIINRRAFRTDGGRS